MRKHLKFLFFLALILMGCVTDFTPEVKGVSGILVVDGTITDGESVFRLSRSVGITDDIRSADTITNAEVSVERSDGVFFKASQESKGAYRAINGALDPNLEYRLNISLDGKHYQSIFLKPLISAGIDSLSYQKKGREEPVTIHVSSHAGPDDPPYYRWTYKENWEVKSALYANARQGANGQIIWHNPNTSENTYYCWVTDSSSVLLLGTADKLAENRLVAHKLFEIPSSDERLSVLYHVEVSQMQIRKEAYDYFKILQDEIERTGSIFSPIMSAGDNGNIFNVSDPDELVIGYVEVATVSREGMFLSYDMNLYLPVVDEVAYCRIFKKGVGMGSDESMLWYRYPETVTFPSCVDCRTKPGATKNRPAWWPNEHY